MKFEAARARNLFFSVEFADVFVPNMGCREGLLAMRTSNGAIVRELRVVFQRALAEKRRRVALSTQKLAMCLLVCDQLFFRLEHQFALLARKTRLASFNVRVVLNLRR